MRFDAIVAALLITGSAAAVTPRERAKTFTPEQVQEHAKVLCSRSGLVDVRLPNGEVRALCGADRDNAVLLYEDLLDLLSRMNTEASREAWVYFPAVGDSIVVFNLERSQEGFYQRPTVAFAVASSAFPTSAKADAVRTWLATQEAVKKGSDSPKKGAIISWHQVE